MKNSDAMHTSNPKIDYKFSWTIENFEWTSKKLRGPSFLPIPGYRHRFCFEIELKSFVKFYVRLIRLSFEDLQSYVSGDIDLSNRERILIRCDTMRQQIICPNTTLFKYRFKYPNRSVLLKFLNNLKDSQLKLEGTLTFSRYQFSSSLSQTAEICACNDCLQRLVLNDLLTMYKSGQGSDVTFSVGTEKIRAHKAILSARSPVFAKMFEHDMVENNTNNVTIEDIDPGTFHDFLVFLYTGDAGDLECGSALSLYSVARKYLVKSLQKVCLVSLGNMMNVDYVCDAMLIADLFEDADLEEIVKRFVQNNFLDIVVTTKWAELITNQPELGKKVTGFTKQADV